ncbi:hypothetical protein [Streptomyces abikoensis]
MFEIRVICDPADIDRVQRSLASVFATQAARTAPARHSDRVRLYLTADHPTTAQPVEASSAYEGAPSLLREMFAVLELGRENTSVADRSYRLRRAALLDRIALHEAVTCPPGVAAEAADGAEWAGWAFAELDHKGEAPADWSAGDSPRDYVRRQYEAHRLTDCVCDAFGEGPCPAHPHP